ncbi:MULTISPECIES: energy transducer TonB [unclassified Pseudomonas]|uniref:energy transducer TonB n=1 Tax=unclassified Pseudomonas TaxID=196821 RepID=UPI000C87ACDA|nr:MULTISPECIES: energy transducer TonB [unclassified Pseudomonas]PMU09226.1 energy transducer TonB [Pseudomonas sp. FW305-20]PMU17779.1 energy transducer TonB [Pseudomonas sp. FW305-122]PMU38711.1 energy transducer TonB [Pseudomonas sp. FW305-47B]PMX61620.1 energy transducer TonB [Pseudomonas sp. FW305-33]PMX70456.1 energy transducer TonB [Pseudomonas sp. FW305-60]
MSDIQRTSIGYISPHGDFGLRNSQALSGVSHLWQDFFAQALADQSGDVVPASLNFPPVDLDSPVEPTVGSELLAHIISQRECDVKETEVRPPEPLFLPIAEFEMELADKPFPPFPPQEIVAQQKQQDFESSWVRPIVLTAGQPVPQAGPAPQPRALHLPIAEFELDLLDKPFPPFSPEELMEQQKQFDFDNGWARPIVLQNLRIAA